VSWRSTEIRHRGDSPLEVSEQSELTCSMAVFKNYREVSDRRELSSHFGISKEFRNVGGSLKGVGPLQG